MKLANYIWDYRSHTAILAAASADSYKVVSACQDLIDKKDDVMSIRDLGRK
jgi:hypothetical protein